MRGESLSGPPPRRVGIRDVAARAGVAISTVSKVFSGKGEVMPALRMRVLTAAAELGYRPNSVAQSLRRGATDLIGFVASDLSEPFSAGIVAGAEYVLRPAGYALVVMSSNHDTSIDAANVRHLNSRRVDALLISPSLEGDRGLLEALAEFDGPIVAIENELRGPFGIDAICADHRRGMREAVDHLAGLGHRRIAALTGPSGRRSGRERAAGFVDAMRSLGLDREPRPIVTEHDADAAEAEVLRLLDGPSSPTAVIVGGVTMLTGTLRAIDHRGLTPGEDIALVGWDNGPLAEFFRPPIAVVDRDPHGLGAAAASLALRRLGHGGVRFEEPPGVEIRPVRFISRRSAEIGIDHDLGGRAHG
ncbi:MAG: LacI family DNA-binding transcriptional regulator [Bauldia sp.]|nr:LacI family DNA-binding transcriptional regulator [Bauldia sp.]